MRKAGKEKDHGWYSAFGKSKCGPGIEVDREGEREREGERVGRERGSRLAAPAPIILD
jgi:hypothetical protein